MTRIIIAILLSFFGPGLGQIYNREYKKGIVILIIATLMVLLPALWMVISLMPSLPDPGDEAALQEMIQTSAVRLMKENRHILNFISFSFLGLWAYAITQSYFKAKEMGGEKDDSKEEN